jgi:flagellar biosynthesis protein FlhF
MILKSIEGRTLAEAIGKAQKECGKDALLVETRRRGDGYVIVAARPPVAAAAKPRAGDAGRAHGFAKGFRPLAEKALDFGLPRELLLAVEQALAGTKVAVARAGDPALPRVAARMLASLIPVTTLDSQRVVALVGPTGVGKTTTLAKLAARAARERGERVVLVTVDTWRIAGVEQLRAFAELIGAPCEVAFTPHALEAILEKHAGADRIFVDTSGRGPRDAPAIDALRRTLAGRGIACALCLPAALRRVDAEAVLAACAALAPTAAILTKWDETRVPGEALATLILAGLPLAHVTTGQSVPDDLFPAEAHALAAVAFDLQGAPDDPDPTQR